MLLEAVATLSWFDEPGVNLEGIGSFWPGVSLQHHFHTIYSFSSSYLTYFYIFSICVIRLSRLLTGFN